MHREPVGRARGKRDGERVQDNGLAWMLAGLATWRPGMCLAQQNFRIVGLAETDVAGCNKSPAPL